MSLYIPKRLLENVCRPRLSPLATPLPGLVAHRVAHIREPARGEGIGASRRSG